MSKKKRLEKKLTQKQRAVALALVEKELGLNPELKGMSNKQLCEHCGIGETTLYKWKKDPDFMGYVDVLSDELFRGQAFLLRKGLLKVMERFANDPVVNAKTIELAASVLGVNVKKSETTQNKNINITTTTGVERPKELQEIADILGIDDTDQDVFQ